MDRNLNPAQTYIPCDQLWRLWKRTQARPVGESTYNVPYEQLPLPFSIFQNHIRKLHHFFLYQSVQSLSRVWLFVTPWTLKHQTSLSITNSQSPLKLMSTMWWCHPTISSSVVPFSSHLQSFQASGSFPMSQFFSSGGHSIGVSASTSVLTVSILDGFPLGLTAWISLQSKRLARVFSNTTVQKHQFFSAQLCLESNSHIHTWLQEKP